MVGLMIKIIKNKYGLNKDEQKLFSRRLNAFSKEI